MKLKKGDTVVVITGKDKGKQGEVQRVLPKADKVIVNGVNTATKHAKARRANDKAGIIDRDMPIHASNVMLVHKGKPVREHKGCIFISKAVILLCAARKSRDADHLQNFVYDALAGIDADQLAADLLAAGREEIPDYAFDCHTLTGRRRGKTKGDFFREEQKALKPFEPGLFDDLSER